MDNRTVRLADAWIQRPRYHCRLERRQTTRAGGLNTDILSGEVEPSRHLIDAIAKNKNYYGEIRLYDFTKGLCIDYHAFDQAAFEPNVEFAIGMY